MLDGGKEEERGRQNRKIMDGIEEDSTVNRQQ